MKSKQQWKRTMKKKRHKKETRKRNVRSHEFRKISQKWRPKLEEPVAMETRA